MSARSRHLGRSRVRALKDAAYLLAGERGLSAVTVRAIEHAVGQAHGHLRHHLGSLAQVIEAVRAQHTFAMIEEFSAAVDQARSLDTLPDALVLLRRALLDGPSNLPEPDWHRRLLRDLGPEAPWLYLLEGWIAHGTAPWLTDSPATGRQIAWIWKALVFPWLQSDPASCPNLATMERILDVAAMELVFRNRHDKNG